MNIFGWVLVAWWSFSLVLQIFYMGRGGYGNKHGVPALVFGSLLDITFITLTLLIGTGHGL